ncbi:hypothetical protein ACHQM5_007039 [Ranunculus cassubicifolius]
MVSVCGVAISSVFFLYKRYKYQQQKKSRGKKPKCTTLEDLPSDKVIKIFSYLSVEDFFKLRRCVETVE